MVWTASAFATTPLGATIGPPKVDFDFASSIIDTSDGGLSIADATDLTFPGQIEVPEPDTAVLFIPFAGLAVLRGRARRH